MHKRANIISCTPARSNYHNGDIMFDVKKMAAACREASYKLAEYTREEKDNMLSLIGAAIEKSEEYILSENGKDLAALNEKDNVFRDRLTLNHDRIALMCEGIREVRALPDPVGEVTETWTVPSGLEISKVRAPLGVVAIIYEARPNVTADAVALTLKSGNAVVLKGGKEAICSNRAIYQAMHDALKAGGYPADVIGFVDDTDRAATAELLSLDQYIDVVIPRGGEGLKHFVAANAKMPVIASAGGNCHVYVEASANLEMANNIVYNAKTQRPSVCNAAESLLVDEKIAAEFLPVCLKRLESAGVKILGCEKTCAIYANAKPASDEDFATEFHDLVISVKVVSGIEDAIAHVNRFSTKHSEAIVTEDKEKADRFARAVDSAAVYVNVSTRFTDGFEFGFGAEMGISTGKLHARGPLGLRELTSQKYVVRGNGQLRK